MQEGYLGTWIRVLDVGWGPAGNVTNCLLQVVYGFRSTSRTELTVQKM